MTRLLTAAEAGVRRFRASLTVQLSPNLSDLSTPSNWSYNCPFADIGEGILANDRLDPLSPMRY